MTLLPLRVPRALALALLAALVVCGPAAAKKPNDAPNAGSGLAGLTCKNGGRDAKLTASRIRKGDRHFLEFRSRPYPGSPSGHLYVVFGELDSSGAVASRYHIGLAPDGLAIGFVGGALVNVPAHLTPRALDCRAVTIDAWRLSITPSQFAAVTRKARARLLNPPRWSMFGFNCNHFAAEFGDIIGLKQPKNRNLMARNYLPAYIKANSN